MYMHVGTPGRTPTQLGIEVTCTYCHILSVASICAHDHRASSRSRSARKVIVCPAAGAHSRTCATTLAQCCQAPKRWRRCESRLRSGRPHGSGAPTGASQARRSGASGSPWSTRLVARRRWQTLAASPAEEVGVGQQLWCHPLQAAEAGLAVGRAVGVLGVQRK